MSEPAEPLPEPLFAEPVLEPLSPPRVELAAVPVRLGPAIPGRVAPEPIAPELALVELIGGASAPWQQATPRPVTSQPAVTGPTALEAAEPESGAAPPAAAAGASTEARPQTGRVVSGRVVSGRGVTGRGVVVLILILTGLVGVLEVAYAGHRGAAFAVAFMLTSAIGALVVRRRDLPTALIAPPLLYCVLIAVLSAIDTHDQSGGFITRKAVYIGNAFVTGAPTLWAGTAAAIAIALYRHRTGRQLRS
ncbi:MAG TPA: DUF6542 domain-containing protein [Acidothermaceae bacterium]